MRSSKEFTEEEIKQLEGLVKDYDYVEKRFREVGVLDADTKLETALNIIIKSQGYKFGWTTAVIFIKDLMDKYYTTDKEIQKKGIVGFLDNVNDLYLRYKAK